MVTLEPKFHSFQQVIPGLYIGGGYGLTNITQMKEEQIKVIIAVNGGATIRVSPHNYPLEIIDFDIDDMPQFFMRPFFLPIHHAIDKCFQEKKNVMVICTAGKSRSATAVISYLMRRKGMSLKQAYRKVKQARDFINPNPGFVGQLKSFEKEIHKCELCMLERKTKWLDQFSTLDFTVVLCDQCDDPVIVANFHAAGKESKNNEEYKEYVDAEYRRKAMEVAERIGRQYFGENKAWAIDSEQRTIPDHFHMHVRDLTSMSPSFLAMHLFPPLRPKL